MRSRNRLALAAGGAVIAILLAAAAVWAFALNGHPPTALTPTRSPSPSASASASAESTPTPPPSPSLPSASPSTTARPSDGSFASPLVPAPSRRGAAAMAYDARTKNVVLFGGLVEQNVRLGDTWS